MVYIVMAYIVMAYMVMLGTDKGWTSALVGLSVDVIVMAYIVMVGLSVVVIRNVFLE